MMRIFLLLAALAAGSAAQNDCSKGACYPPTGDLLVGRGHLLHASSTCGLAGSEVFCTPFHQWRMKCCPCDSRNPSSGLAHTVQNVLSTARPNRWWQSKKDVNPVTLQLDLQDLFQLDNLILDFKGPRPDSLVIERTLDKGQTWKPALYLASDCRAAFPGVPMATPLTMDQTYCYTLAPVGPNPYRDQIIQFSPLRQYTYVPAPESQKIENVSGLTGLRVRLTDLGEVPRLPGRALSHFYALKEMKVMGSCMCHGHADRCLSDSSSNSLDNSIQVSAQCKCQHNTAGVNCEHCADLYNDLPWKPAEEGNPHTCQRCDCNNHALRCHFDQAVFEASGQRSGGVCERCMHHTTGPKCDQCAPGYQPNPRSTMDSPDACTRCICSVEGTVNGGQCDDTMGSCKCKANVEGPRCDRCRRGHYSLSASNPLGCTKCLCSPDGSRSSECDPLTGQCPCNAHFHGLTCDRCSKGRWKPLGATGCVPCSCDPTNSIGDTCDQWIGQCQCRQGFGGLTCSECPDNTYGDPLVGCQPCNCASGGTISGGCDKRTGACHCRLGVKGARCDSCSRGYCDSFPTCEVCPYCFFNLDGQIRNLSMSAERLSLGHPSPPVVSVGPESLVPRIRALEARLNKIKDSLPLPPNSAGQIKNVLSQFDMLREQVEQLNDGFLPLDRVPNLESQLKQLQSLVDSLDLSYNLKTDQLRNPINANNTGAFSAIKNAYDESADAAKSMEASSETVDQSASTRGDTIDLQNQVQPANTRDLEKLNTSLAFRPNLTPAAKQVCGSTRTTPCTPLQCEGYDLCPVGNTPSCDQGDGCVGPQPLGHHAEHSTRNVKDRLGQLNGKIAAATDQVQEAHATTDNVRTSTEKLSNQIKQVRNDLEGYLKETRDVVKEVKDFLSDPSSNLTRVKAVSDWILNAKLPLNLAGLKRKLEELKILAAGLPDSAEVLKRAGPQLDAASRLLQEAREARDTALGVKADVNGLLLGFGAVESSLTSLEDKLQDSMYTIDNLNNTLSKVDAQLTPVEKALGEVTSLAGGMKPQLISLKDLLLSGGRLADDAEEEASGAKAEAKAAAKDLTSLEEQLGHLRAANANASHGDGAGTAGERLQKLQQDAGTLAKDTGDMMKSLADKADSLRRLQVEVGQKSGRLQGLDAKLQALLAEIRAKAHDHFSCQG